MTTSIPSQVMAALTDEWQTVTEVCAAMRPLPSDVVRSALRGLAVSEKIDWRIGAPEGGPVQSEYRSLRKAEG